VTVGPAIKSLLARKPTVVALGVRLFTEALEAQQVPVVPVDWSPPAGGDREMLDVLAELL
jgi:hypothetical protein